MRRFGFIWLLLTGAIAGVASYFSYQAGLTAGLATKLPEGAAPYFLYGQGWGGGGFFGFFWFLLFLFLIFGLVRRVMWGGRRGWYGGGRNGPGRDERVREWHRQLHEQEEGQKPG